MHKPKVLILDEPTNGLDPTQIIEIRDLIRRLAETATVVVSTHILSEVEATCAPRHHHHERPDQGRRQARGPAQHHHRRGVSVEKGASDVQAALAAIPGVSGVAADGPATAGAAGASPRPRISSCAR
jgi:ABC-2 type transport system ATP-binding protein